MRLITGAIAGAVALIALGTASAATAQEYWRRAASAQNQMRELERGERFAFSAQRCRDSIERRRAEWMVVWCDIATEAAVQQRDRDNRRDYNEVERELLWDAAWLQALEGIQDRSFFAAPLVERVSIADEDSTRRLIAYRLLSNLRSRDYREIEHYVRQLGEVEGIEIGAAESLLVGRRRLIDALLSQPRTPERLWAIAAAALTFDVEYRAVELAPEVVAADALEAAARLGELSAETANLTGQDAALMPLLLYAQSKALWIARDYESGQRAGEAGYDACVERLWAGASICLDLGLEGATARVLAMLHTANPALMARRPEPALSSRERGTEYTEARCRVILVGDVDDTGDFVNERIEYENPNGLCRSMALRYANARRYRPASQAIEGMRRQNIIIRFVLTSP